MHTTTSTKVRELADVTLHYNNCYSCLETNEYVQEKAIQ